jgi:hypothetical protein
MDIKYQDEILKLSRLIISCSSLLVCIFISCRILGIIFGITGDYHVIPTIFLLSILGYYITIGCLYWTIIITYQIRNPIK